MDEVDRAAAIDAGVVAADRRGWPDGQHHWFACGRGHCDAGMGRRQTPTAQLSRRRLGRQGARRLQRHEGTDKALYEGLIRGGAARMANGPRGAGGRRLGGRLLVQGELLLVRFESQGPDGGCGDADQVVGRGGLRLGTYQQGVSPGEHGQGGDARDRTEPEPTCAHSPFAACRCLFHGACLPSGMDRVERPSGLWRLTGGAVSTMRQRRAGSRPTARPARRCLRGRTCCWRSGRLACSSSGAAGW